VPEEVGSAPTPGQRSNSRATTAAITATAIQTAAGTPLRAALCGGGCSGSRPSSAIAWRMAAGGAGRPAASSSVSNEAAAGSCAESMVTVRPLGIVARNCAVVGAVSCVAATAGLARRPRAAFADSLLASMLWFCKHCATSAMEHAAQMGTTRGQGLRLADVRNPQGRLSTFFLALVSPTSASD